MKRIVVRYKIKPEKVAENERLIQNVFLELGARSPDGFRYAALKLPDGAFVHLVEREEGSDPLPKLNAFQAFLDGIRERCLEPPQSSEAMIVGDYRLIGEARNS